MPVTCPTSTVFQRDELYTPEFKSTHRRHRSPRGDRGSVGAASGDALIDVMLEVDVNTYLPGDLLVKMDIATMAHSLEARSPLLDPEVMEFAASLPADLKMSRNGEEGHPPRRPARLDPRRDPRPAEMGFGVPLAEWFRTDLRGYLSDVLFDPVTLDRGYFARTSCERISTAT